MSRRELYRPARPIGPGARLELDPVHQGSPTLCTCTSFLKTRIGPWELPFIGKVAPNVGKE